MRYGRTFPAKPIIGRITLVILTSPLPPTNLAVVAANGSTTLSLSWTNNALSLTNTRVEVSSDGATGWAEIANSPVASPGTSTTHAVGSNSTLRYYRARAYESSTGLYSGYTSVVSATTAPAAPTIGAVTAANDSNNLSVAFTDNSSDETTFSIEASANGVSGFSEVGTSATSPYSHNVGARDTTRYYRVRAYRSGDGIYSDYSAVSTAATTAPADPSALAVSPGGTTAVLTWTDNSSSESTFSIERKPSGGAYAVIGTDSASPYNDSGLTIDSTYYWKVRAYRASDGIYSGYAAEVSGTTGTTAPSNVTGGCVDETTAASKVRLYWDIGSTLETGTRIQRSTDQSTWSTVVTTAAGVHTYTNTGLAANTTYYYRLASVNAGGFLSDWTDTLTVKTNTSCVGSLMLAFLQKTHNLPPS